jgi:phenylalanyl-tRNA synthetase beta chain
MLISRVWLGELLGGDLPDDGALADLITSLGLEVEGTTRCGDAVGDVVVGVVVARVPHPEAERLTLVTIDAGSGEVPVVCGAGNVPQPGGRVAFAPVGSVLPGGFAIEPRQIRGERSEGMICSEQELDIGTDGDGIMVLPSDWTAGDRLADRIPGVVDTVFELSVTPNRPDALGHVGLARDLAVKLQRTVQLPAATRPEVTVDPGLVTLQAPQRCGRYLGYVLTGATVGTSPPWLRVRLHRLGLRAINDVVDVTNLVLMEWGQPLHAFDRDRLAEGRVVVRPATADEPLETLDGQTLKLTTDDLVIADAKAPQALAGVMGGAGSGVERGATQLLLEAAWFAPAGIRTSARRHQLSSDSSYRFERGVDHGDGLDRACARALSLLVELTGATVTAGCEVRGVVPAVPQIRLRPERTRKLLGMVIPDDEAQRVLRGLGVEVDASDPAEWSCRPPTGRPDLAREEDLIEEVMRHHGLEGLPAVHAVATGATAVASTAVRDPAGALGRWQVDRLVDAFAAGGLHETISLAFADPDKSRAVLGDAVLARAVTLDNPMRQQAAQLRLHLLPGLLDAAALNGARHGHGVRLFEVGRVYAWGESEAAPPPHEDAADHGVPTVHVDVRLPRERLVAAVLVDADPADAADDGAAARRAVSALLDALARIGLRGHVTPPQTSVAYLHPGIQAQIFCGDHQVGVAGQVHPDLVGTWELGAEIGYGEIWVDRLPPLSAVAFEAVPRFPATTRDVSIDLADAVVASQVIETIRRQDASIVPAESADDPARLQRGDRGDGAIEVVEAYRGEGVAPGRRALLLRLHYRAKERSVTDGEVQAHHDAVVEGTVAQLREIDPDARRR